MLRKTCCSSKPSGLRPPTRYWADREAGRNEEHRPKSQDDTNNPKRSEPKVDVKFVYPDERWIRDESPPPLVPSETYLPAGDDGGMFSWFESDTEWIEDETPPQLVPSDTFFSEVNDGGLYSWYDSEAEWIEDEAPPPLVPSELYLPHESEGTSVLEPDDTDDDDDIVRLGFELRGAELENRELRTENRPLKETKKVGLINRLCFRFLLFVAGEVTEGLLSSLN